MREILFRGKRSDNGEWVIGSFTNWNQLCFDNKTPKMGIVTENELQYFDCLPETIGQYVGYSDINGKRIFDGDIVRFLDITSTESGYSEMDCCGIVGYDKKEICFFVTGRLSAESWEVLEECAVIGNIFDNPEFQG